MNWTELEIQTVWDKGAIAEKINPQKWRKDACGAWIARNYYGDRSSKFGWEIDPAPPGTGGGAKDVSKLQPLHWKNAGATNGGKLTCVVTAYGGDNFEFS